jgi:predicted sulfurtransferase
VGRKKLTSDEKRENLSITISRQNNKKFEELEIKNKSKLIEWLLDNYFDSFKK